MRSDNFDKVSDLWSSDAEFRKAVRSDPLKELSARGIVLTADEKRALETLQIGKLSDSELEARVSKAVC